MTTTIERWVLAALLVAALFVGEAAASDAPMVRVTGSPTPVFSGASHGLRFVPDGHLSVLRRKGGDHAVWWGGGTMAGGGYTIAATSATLRDFRPVDAPLGIALPAFGPIGGTTAFDADYAAPGSVVRDPAFADERHLLMFYHGENHTFAGVTHPAVPYYASIGLARSSDGGRRWTRVGKIVDGLLPHGDGPAPRGALGAGTPSVVAHDGWWYLFYVDWNTSLPDAIHLARAPISGGGLPGTWSKWHDGAFAEPGIGGVSTPVILPPAPADRSIYAAMPDVSWNTALGRFLMIYECDDAFRAASSTDLITWSTPTAFLANPAGAASRRSGQTWMSYPTLVSLGTDSDRVTGASGQLFHARGVWDVVEHTLWRIPIAIAPPAGGSSR